MKNSKITKNIDDLRSDLEDSPLEQQIDALCDGEFLSKFNVTQEEVENLHNDLCEKLKDQTDVYK